VLAVAVLTGLTTPPAAEAQLNVTGQWSTSSQLAPVQPIHVALMRTGKLLMIEGSANDSTQNFYRYAVWNPATGAATVGTTPWDLFCNSMSFFPDGRLLISGGNGGYNPFTGIKTTTIFDPATEKFIHVEDTAGGRWYPTTVMLQDGGVMSFSGLDETGGINFDTEIYDVGIGWAGPYPAPFEPKYYPRLHLLGNGKVLMTGPDPATRTFDPATGTWTSPIVSHPYGGSRMNGTSVMLPPEALRRLRHAFLRHRRRYRLAARRRAPARHEPLELDLAGAAEPRSASRDPQRRAPAQRAGPRCRRIGAVQRREHRRHERAALRSDDRDVESGRHAGVRADVPLDGDPASRRHGLDGRLEPDGRGVDPAGGDLQAPVPVHEHRRARAAPVDLLVAGRRRLRHVLLGRDGTGTEHLPGRARASRIGDARSTWSSGSST